MNPPDSTSIAQPESHPLRMERRRAWGGLWSLIWKSQLNARRAPRLLALCLILPVLAAVIGGAKEGTTYLMILFNLHLAVAVPLISLITMAAPIRDEAEQGTLAYLTVRPLNRGIFFLLFHASHLLWLELIFLLSGLLLLGVGLWRDVPGWADLALPFLLAQAAGILAFSSLSAVAGMLTRRYLILGLLYGAVIEIGIGSIPTNINVLSLSHHVRVLASASETASAFLVANQGNAFFSFFVLVTVGLIGTAIGASIYNYREFTAGPDA